MQMTTMAEYLRQPLCFLRNKLKLREIKSLNVTQEKGVKNLGQGSLQSRLAEAPDRQWLQIR